MHISPPAHRHQQLLLLAIIAILGSFSLSEHTGLDFCFALGLANFFRRLGPGLHTRGGGLPLGIPILCLLTIELQV